MPLNCNLLLTNLARKELAKISKGNFKSAQSISAALAQLQNNPNLGLPLHGDLKGRHKLMIGDYRIVYRYDKKADSIFILKIAHRKDVYR